MRVQLQRTVLAQEAKIECHGGHSQAGFMANLVLLQAFRCFHFLSHDFAHVRKAVPGHPYVLGRSRFQHIQAIRYFHYLFHDLLHVPKAVPRHTYGLDRARFQRIQAFRCLHFLFYDFVHVLKAVQGHTYSASTVAAHRACPRGEN